jgi:hypothetical protein
MIFLTASISNMLIATCLKRIEIAAPSQSSGSQ